MKRFAIRFAIGVSLAVTLTAVVLPGAVDGQGGLDSVTVNIGATLDPNG